MAMMMSIAVALYSYASRGNRPHHESADCAEREFDSGNLLKKAENMIPCWFRCFGVGAFKRADRLAHSRWKAAATTA